MNKHAPVSHGNTLHGKLRLLQQKPNHLPRSKDPMLMEFCKAFEKIYSGTGYNPP